MPYSACQRTAQKYTATIDQRYRRRRAPSPQPSPRGRGNCVSRRPNSVATGVGDAGGGRGAGAEVGVGGTGVGGLGDGGLGDPVFGGDGDVAHHVEELGQVDRFDSHLFGLIEELVGAGAADVFVDVVLAFDEVAGFVSDFALEVAFRVNLGVDHAAGLMDDIVDAGPIVGAIAVEIHHAQQGEMLALAGGTKRE